MPTFTAAVPDEVKDLECTICLEPWDRPVELQPCRHVYCTKCSDSLSSCPECRAQISGRKPPNRILINMSEAAEMKCEDCGWRGSREATRSHSCDTSRALVGREGSAVWEPPKQTTQNPWSQPAPNIPNHPSPPPASQQQQQWAPPPAQHAPPMPPPQAAGPWTNYGMTQDEYDHIMTVFLTFDADDSGELDRREVTTLARWLNYAHSERDIDNMFRAMDTDGSGSLSMDEFCRWCSTNQPDSQALYGLTKAEYESTLFAFHSYDRDQNGCLDQREFTQLAVRQGWSRHDGEAAQLFASIDADRNNSVDLNEILMFMAQRKRGAGAPGQMPPQQRPPQQQQQPVPQFHAAMPPQHQHHHHHHSFQQPPQQQAPPAGYPQQQQRPMMLDGRIVEVDLGEANRNVGPLVVTVAPIFTAPELFRTDPSPSKGRFIFNADFSVPVYPTGPNDQAVFRVYVNNQELCGATLRLADVPPSNTQPADLYLQLHAKDRNRFNASGARVRVRVSMMH